VCGTGGTTEIEITSKKEHARIKKIFFTYSYKDSYEVIVSLLAQQFLLKDIQAPANSTQS
jgi:hypothetical protein